MEEREQEDKYPSTEREVHYPVEAREELLRSLVEPTHKTRISYKVVRNPKTGALEVKQVETPFKESFTPDLPTANLSLDELRIVYVLDGLLSDLETLEKKTEWDLGKLIDKFSRRKALYEIGSKAKGGWAAGIIQEQKVTQVQKLFEEFSSKEQQEKKSLKEKLFGGGGNQR